MLYKLLEIIQKIIKKSITDKEIRSTLFNLLIIDDNLLDKYNLTIEYIDYGIYKLKQNGDYLMEGELIECHNKAFEIINKI